MTAKTEMLPDGTTRVTLPRSFAWLPVARTEWLIQPDCLEVRRRLLGITRRKRYTAARLTMEPRRRRSATTWSLVLQAGRERITLVAGGEDTVRALGQLLAHRTGWRLRIDRAAGIRPDAPAFSPVLAIFIAGGLFMAGVGFFQARKEAATIRRLPHTSAIDFASRTPGAAVLATGVIATASGETPESLLLYDAHPPSLRGRVGLWQAPARPPFKLHLGDGAIPVHSAGAVLALPPHTLNLESRLYLGFRAGDTATVLGSPAHGQGRAVLVAQIIYSGAPESLARYVQRHGRIMAVVGLSAALAGILFLHALRRAR